MTGPSPAQPPLVRGPGGCRLLPFDRLGGGVEVAQEVEEVEDIDKTPGSEVELEEGPVVLLPVADVALALSPVQPTALDLGGHLPAELLTGGHTRHYRPHQLPRPPLGPLPPRPWPRLQR